MAQLVVLGYGDVWSRTWHTFPSPNLPTSDYLEVSVRLRHHPRDFVFLAFLFGAPVRVTMLLQSISNHLLQDRAAIQPRAGAISDALETNGLFSVRN